jgi:hypothetical protein
MNYLKKYVYVSSKFYKLLEKTFARIEQII